VEVRKKFRHIRTVMGVRVVVHAIGPHR
jgi:hypothetical protein